MRCWYHGAVAGRSASHVPSLYIRTETKDSDRVASLSPRAPERGVHPRFCEKNKLSSSGRSAFHDGLQQDASALKHRGGKTPKLPIRRPGAFFFCCGGAGSLTHLLVCPGCVLVPRQGAFFLLLWRPGAFFFFAPEAGRVFFSCCGAAGSLTHLLVCPGCVLLPRQGAFFFWLWRPGAFSFLLRRPRAFFFCCGGFTHSLVGLPWLRTPPSPGRAFFLLWRPGAFFFLLRRPGAFFVAVEARAHSLTCWSALAAYSSLARAPFFLLWRPGAFFFIFAPEAARVFFLLRRRGLTHSLVGLPWLRTRPSPGRVFLFAVEAGRVCFLLRRPRAFACQGASWAALRANVSPCKSTSATDAPWHGQN